jgi:hypothetical protein
MGVVYHDLDDVRRSRQLHLPLPRWDLLRSATLASELMAARARCARSPS